MSEALSLQTPELAWAEAAARGEVQGVGWVGVGREPAFTQRLGPDGVVRWHGADRGAHLPPPVAEAAAEAMASGAPTAWEGLTLVLGRAEWLVASRGLLWTTSSPAPALLARLLEGAGVQPGLHRGDPDRLRRLAALLPRWGAGRGTLARAREVLEAAGEGAQAAAALSSAPPADDSTAPAITAGEVFVARTDRFWARRRVEDRAPILRIRGGLLRFQPRVGAAVAVGAEDLLVRVHPDAPPPRDLYRLLPAWTVARPVAAKE